MLWIIIVLIVCAIVERFFWIRVTIDLVDRALPRTTDEQSIRDKIVQLLKAHRPDKKPKPKKEAPGKAGSTVGDEGGEGRSY